jgi:DNA-binding FrmR family transcriptional regulator
MLKSNEKKLVNRLHIIQGQMKGLEKMVEGKNYCVDIITQSLAIQKSLQSFNQEMLKNHLQEHITHQFHNGQGNKAISELLKINNLKNK